MLERRELRVLVAGLVATTVATTASGTSSADAPIRGSVAGSPYVVNTLGCTGQPETITAAPSGAATLVGAQGGQGQGALADFPLGLGALAVASVPLVGG